MEQLNRVELRGTVGSVYVKDFGNTRCVNFSVATNYCFKDREGCPVIETTWHRVIAWENQDTADAFRMKKGDSVHVLGRLRIDRRWRLWLTGFTSMNNRNPPLYRGGFFLSSLIRQPAVA